jgi:hypothetical protein
VPELIPPRQVHFRHGSGVVVAGWALFHNPSTGVWEVEWVTPAGRRVVDYVPTEALVPAAAQTRLAGRELGERRGSAAGGDRAAG